MDEQIILEYFEKIGERSENKDDKCKDNRYDEETMRWIQIAYLIGVGIWIILVAVLKLYSMDIITWIFIIFPIIIFGINYRNVEKMTYKCEKQMFRGNFISFGFLITIILINWNCPMEASNKNNFFKILVVAFVLLMFSLVDIWVSKENLSIVKNIKTIFHTISLTLLAWALYLYYIYQRDESCFL